MATILDRIIQTKRREVEAALSRHSLAEWRKLAEAAAPPRDFLGSVLPIKERCDMPRLIAEIKRKSPSAGEIVRDFDPVRIARVYHQHGAAALSVLTDETYFGGSPSFITAVRDAIPLPVLRKEFVIDDVQVCESRAAGADAILLIAEVLAVDDIARFTSLARDLGLAVLVEVHSESNLRAVLDRLGPPSRNGYLLGINNRDLAVQRTDLSTTARLAKLLPPGAPFVSESGIHTPEDVAIIRAAGASAMLVGESLLRGADIGARVDALIAPRFPPAP